MSLYTVYCFFLTLLLSTSSRSHKKLHGSPKEVITSKILAPFSKKLIILIIDDIVFVQVRHHVSSTSANGVAAPPAPVVDTDSTSFAAADLPERPSPDGGEDHDPTSDDETEAWSDWDVPDNTVSQNCDRRILLETVRQNG